MLPISRKTNTLSFILCALLITSQAFAESYGDKHCNIYLVEARNIGTGCCGNYYSAQVALSKRIIASDFREFAIHLSYSNSHFWAEWGSIEPLSDPKDTGDYLIYNFKLPFGAVHRSETIKFIPYVSNGIDRLYDNNFDPQKANGTNAYYVELKYQNNWWYKAQICR